MSIQDYLQSFDDFIFIEFSNGSTPKEEFIILQAQKNIPTMHTYIIFDNTYNEDSHYPENIFQHYYWFPNVPIKKNEFICISTGKSPEGKKYFLGEDEEANVMHFFYWGSDKCIWNDTGDVIHLFKINLPPSVIIIPAKKK